MAATSLIELPKRRLRYRFALTPLADAMFQLLIFFMLSSGLTPYSLLTLKSAPLAQSAETPAVGTTEDPNEASIQGVTGAVLWTVESQAVIVGGQRFDFDAIDDLARALSDKGTPPPIILIVRPSAQVQDITTVLARLKTAKITAVQISTGAI